MSHLTEINLIFNKSHQKRPECSICFQRINKMAISCSSPCNKVFHASCLERVFEQEQEKQAEEVANGIHFYSRHRCCYCRRYINIRSYLLKKFAHELIALKNSRCFYVDEALEQVLYNLNIELKYTSKERENFLEKDTFYEIYEIVNTTRLKIPKQSKHAQYKRTRIPRQNLIVHRNKNGRI